MPMLGNAGVAGSANVVTQVVSRNPPQMAPSTQPPPPQVVQSNLPPLSGWGLLLR